MKFRILILSLSVMLLIGCSSLDRQQKHFDRFEKFNRSMYNFNYNVLDSYLIRFIAIAWRDYIPQSTRNGIINFTNNLEEPAIAVNYFLQGNPYHGMIHFTRVFLNTLLGMGGFIDVANLSNQKLQHEKSHRFGSTLGHYGISYGPYIHLPFYGSFTLREDVGNMADMFYPMLSWLTWPFSIGKLIIEGIETRSQLLEFDGLLNQFADPYIMVREIYFQNHDFIAKDKNITSVENLNAKIIENYLSEIDTE